MDAECAKIAVDQRNNKVSQLETESSKLAEKSKNFDKISKDIYHRENQRYKFFKKMVWLGGLALGVVVVLAIVVVCLV